MTRDPLYFVTFCTHQRRPFLARDEVHAAFVLFAERAGRDFNIGVGRYVIVLTMCIYSSVEERILGWVVGSVS